MAHAPVGMILSAGFGTRLYPLTLFRPKPIMEVAAKPIIYFLIKTLENAGVRDIILNLHHFPEQVQSALERMDFKSRIHLVYEKNILGTAGGIANALTSLGIKNRGLVVMHGDILCDFNLKSPIENQEFCRLICDEDRQIEGYKGSVGVDNQGNIVELGKFYSSSPPTRRGFFTGIHILSPQAVELIKASPYQNLVAEIYPRWLQEGRIVKGVIEPLIYDDLGTPFRIFRTNMAVLKDCSRFAFLDCFKNFTLQGPQIYVGEGVKIAKGVELHGPLMIARDAHIHEHVILGPQSIVGENSVVHARAAIRNSVVMSHTVIEKDEHLDCVIGLSGARVLVKEPVRG